LLIGALRRYDVDSEAFHLQWYHDPKYQLVHTRHFLGFEGIKITIFTQMWALMRRYGTHCIAKYVYGTHYQKNWWVMACFEGEMRSCTSELHQQVLQLYTLRNICFIHRKWSIHLFPVFHEYIKKISVRSQLLWQNFAQVPKSWKKKCTSQSTCFTHITIDPLFYNIIFYVHTVYLLMYSSSTLAHPNSPCLANIVSIFFRGHVLHYFFRLSVPPSF
jgi:hypothetical protein